MTKDYYAACRFLYWCILFRYRKALPALPSCAVLCVPSRISNFKFFLCQVVVKCNVFGPWCFLFPFFFFGWCLSAQIYPTVEGFHFSYVQLLNPYAEFKRCRFYVRDLFNKTECLVIDSCRHARPWGSQPKILTYMNNIRQGQ